MHSRVLSCLMATAISLPAAAATQGTVEAVQAPAWVTRDGRTEPMAAGAEVRNGDQLRTGEGARAMVRLADGSTVKLGQSAQLVFYGRSADPAGFFRGALDVAAGAFRFTTDLLRRVRGRDVQIRVGTATAGVRGTDLWGRSDQEADLVCLIEGHIEIAHRGQMVELNQPLSFFVAPRGQAAKPVGAVDPDKLKQWARETEILPGDGASRRDGRWSLSFGREREPAQALARYDTLRRGGYAARIRTLPVAGGWEYEVKVPGFASAEEANAAARAVRSALELEATPGR